MEVCDPIHRTKVSTDTLVQGWLTKPAPAIQSSNRLAPGALM